jgi:1-deoxy-D-xylulose-5-phosphate synthase
MDAQRYPRLSRITYPADLRQFPEAELPAVAAELREYLIESVGQSGGHFGAGLGVIELTVALHWVYDTPNDRLVWESATRPTRTRSSPAAGRASPR